MKHKCTYDTSCSRTKETPTITKWERGKEKSAEKIYFQYSASRLHRFDAIFLTIFAGVVISSQDNWSLSLHSIKDMSLPGNKDLPSTI